jgi:hypothetical protein
MVAALISGCGTFPENDVFLDMNTPTSTPFDSNPAARAVYLESYHEGYRDAMSGEDTSGFFSQGPNRFAQELGRRAGAAEATSKRR